MSEQVPLFPPPKKPAGAGPALLVLRDWLMSSDLFPARYERMNEIDLVALGLRQGAPEGLTKLAREAAETKIRGHFDPFTILTALRATAPRCKTRLLSVSDVLTGIDAHIDGLWRASSYALPLDSVHTTVLCPRGNLDAKGDQVVLRGIDRFEASRNRRAWQHVCRTQIDLPRGWRASLRARGEQAPWEELPAGWTMSGNKCWLQRELKRSPADV